MTTNDTQAFARECAEIANALKSEYGEIKKHRGVAYFDFAKHVYVGRAGALLLQAAALASRQDQQGQPPYPEGEVVGPCVCGSWPGGKCLKCEWRPAAPSLPVGKEPTP